MLNSQIIYISALILVLIYSIYSQSQNSNKISELTDQWIHTVTKLKNSKMVGALFCPDGNLVGTVSQTLRTGKNITEYFKYFAKLDGLEVLSKQYNISKVTDDVYINTAFIEWKWDGIDEPIIARMTFVFRNNCIFQLHSSVLPEKNTDLRKISRV